MAVKKRKIVADNQKQLDLIALAKYVQLLNDQPNYSPHSQELVKHCNDILKCLSNTVGTEEQLWQLLHPVEEFLLRIVTSVHSNICHQIFITILDKFYSYICDPQSDASPAIAAVLVIIEGSNEETVLSAARWIVNQREDDPSGSGHKAALSRLYRWLYEWHSTAALGSWLMAYIKALEENQRYDILIEASIENVVNLFLAMGNPVPLRRSYADVIFHVLASLRESTEAFDKISSHIENILVNLASENGQWSRHLLQNLVDILTAMIDSNLENSNMEEQESFRYKYSDVILCLERHISSRTSSFLPAWRNTVDIASVTPDNIVQHSKIKVGLINLGNTCYMNSILQALFAARNFSTTVMLNMAKSSYWSDIGDLFAKMLHSISPTISPIEVYKSFKPPFFHTNHQHDSSEFLGHLFQLLRSSESSPNEDNSYSQPSNGKRVRFIFLDWGEKVQAGSSHAESHKAGTCYNKRLANESENHVLRKRARLNNNSYQKRASIIDDMFGGSLITRVECSQCHSYSISRDVFCELQLSFPEKLMDKTHSVQSLLEYYCSKERMSGDNRYQCRDCRELRDADRSVGIDKCPRYLVLVLKTFQFDLKNKVHAKLMHKVSCNPNIVLPTVRSPRNSGFNLFAAVIHSGTNIDSGHYYTVAKDEDGWYKYDDSVVTIFDEKMLNNLGPACTPYILFYKRSDVEDVRTPTLVELPRKLRESINKHNTIYKTQR